MKHYKRLEACMEGPAPVFYVVDGVLKTGFVYSVGRQIGQTNLFELDVIDSDGPNKVHTLYADAIATENTLQTKQAITSTTPKPHLPL